MVAQTVAKFASDGGQGSTWGGNPKTLPEVRSAIPSSQSSGKVVKTASATSSA
jgi:hypothetical protein